MTRREPGKVELDLIQATFAHPFICTFAAGAAAQIEVEPENTALPSRSRTTITESSPRRQLPPAQVETHEPGSEQQQSVPSGDHAAAIPVDADAHAVQVVTGNGVTVL